MNKLRPDAQQAPRIVAQEPVPPEPASAPLAQTALLDELQDWLTEARLHNAALDVLTAALLTHKRQPLPPGMRSRGLPLLKMGTLLNGSGELSELKMPAPAPRDTLARDYVIDLAKLAPEHVEPMLLALMQGISQSLAEAVSELRVRMPYLMPDTSSPA